MRFWKWLLRGTLAVMVLNLNHLVSHPVAAQTAESTPDKASPTLTLVWQSEFSPDALLISPNDVAVDADGNVYVSTQGSQTIPPIKKFDSSGKFVTQWGAIGKGDGQFNVTSGIAVDAQSNVYIADFNGMRIQKFDSNGKYLMQWATEPPAGPASVVIDAQGNAYVDNFNNHKHFIQKFDVNGKLITQWGSGGTNDGEFGARPEDITLDWDGNVYIADRLNHRIQKFDADGNFLTQFGGDASTKGNGLFDDPGGVAVDVEGNIYVVDGYFLQKLDANGKPIGQWSVLDGLLNGTRTIVAVDQQDNIYVFASGDVKSPTGETVHPIVVKKFSQTAPA